jgi:uncharacterized protein YkwD
LSTASAAATLSAVHVPRWFALLCLSIASCAASGASRGPAGVATNESGAWSAKNRGASQWPPLPAAAEYATGRTAGGSVAAKSDPNGPELAAALERAWAHRGGAALEEDNRLSSLAHWLASCERGGLPFSLKSAEFGARRLGIPFPAPAALGVTFGPEVTSDVLEQEITRSLSGLPNNFPYSRYGIAVLAEPDRRIGVLVLSPAEVSFDPIARRVHQGESVTLRGAIAERFAKTRFSVTAPDGKIRDSAKDGRAFEQRVVLPGKGAYQIELLGDGPTGPVVLANFPVYVDVDEPSNPPEEDQLPSDGAPLTSAAAEARLIDLVNGERKKAGIPPVAPLESLASVALAHSQDMADHGFFGHVSPTTGTTADRITRAGLVLAVYGENVGAGSSAEEVHRELMASPAHRAVVLDPRFSHVGIGVVVKKDGTVPVLATEVFGKPPRIVDPEAGRADLIDRLNRLRAKQGLAAVRASSELDRAAARGLDLELGDPSADLEQASKVVTSDLSRSAAVLSRLGVHSVGVLGTKVYSPDELLSSEVFLDPHARVIGVAISPPISRDHPHQLAVVVIGVGK